MIDQARSPTPSAVSPTRFELAKPRLGRSPGYVEGADNLRIGHRLLKAPIQIAFEEVASAAPVAGFGGLVTASPSSTPPATDRRITMAQHHRAFDHYRRAVLSNMAVMAAIAAVCSAAALSGLGFGVRAATVAAFLTSMIVYLAVHLVRLARHLGPPAPSLAAAAPAGRNPGTGSVERR